MACRYLQSPAFMGARTRPGEDHVDVQNSFQVMNIAMSTGSLQPLLLNDFSHVLAGMPAAPLRARAAAAFAAFQADLRALVRTIDERNARRRHPLQTFNPRFVLSAVSI